MGETRTYPDGYTYAWLTDLAAEGEPVEPGYDGIVFVHPPRVLRFDFDGNQRDVLILSVSRLPLGQLVASAIDSDGNSVVLPAISPSGEFEHSVPPANWPVDSRGREVAKWLAERYLGSDRTRDPAGPA